MQVGKSTREMKEQNTQPMYTVSLDTSKEETSHVLLGKIRQKIVFRKKEKNCKKQQQEPRKRCQERTLILTVHHSRVAFVL